MTALTFEKALPQLTVAYERGVLVPFLGAGMSRDACPTWAELIRALEQKAGIEADQAKDSAADLIRRADRVSRAIRRSTPDRFAQVIRKALYPKGTTEPPAQTRHLAVPWWPLVLTTNYDDLFVRAFRREHGRKHEPIVCGRRPEDCQRVLSSLSSTAQPILWALQGHLPQRTRSRTKDEDASDAALEREVVLGHEEYRRVTHREPHFRRVFAEVYRRRSFLFLGSGLGEEYFLDLFGEVAEFHGPSGMPHFAIMASENPKDRVDAAFLRSRYGIFVIEVPKYDDVRNALAQLAERGKVARQRPVSWGFAHRGSDPAAPISTAELEVVLGGFPAQSLPAGEVLVVSSSLKPGGAHPALYPGSSFRAAAATLSADYAVDADSLEGDAKEGRFAGEGGHMYLPPRTAQGRELPLVVAAPWRDSRTRDTRYIGPALEEVLSWAHERSRSAGAIHLRSSLLGAGKDTHFSRTFSLVEMTRAFGRWKRANPDSPVRLTIHVMNVEVAYELTTGRLDLLEVLEAVQLRYWLEVIAPDGAVERGLAFDEDATPLAAVLERVGVPASEDWVVEVEPDPLPRRAAATGGNGDRTTGVHAAAPLSELGVFPGSTLRLRRRTQVGAVSGGDAIYPSSLTREESHAGRPR